MFFSGAASRGHGSNTPPHPHPARVVFIFLKKSYVDVRVDGLLWNFRKGHLLDGTLNINLRVRYELNNAIVLHVVLGC